MGGFGPEDCWFESTQDIQGEDWRVFWNDESSYDASKTVFRALKSFGGNSITSKRFRIFLESELNKNGDFKEHPENPSIFSQFSICTIIDFYVCKCGIPAIRSLSSIVQKCIPIRHKSYSRALKIKKHCEEQNLEEEIKPQKPPVGFTVKLIFTLNSPCTERVTDNEKLRNKGLDEEIYSCFDEIKTYARVNPDEIVMVCYTQAYKTSLQGFKDLIKGEYAEKDIPSNLIFLHVDLKKDENTNSIKIKDIELIEPH